MSIEPRATYRLQLTPDVGFAEATALLPYLAELGVSHVYLSPVFEANAGSRHGYDVVNFQRVRRELGGEPGFEALVAAARRHGLGLLLDIVPNHMAVAGHDNPWWWDVLENGRASPYADFFDLDWPSALADEGLILPVLGDQYGRVLEAGEIRVQRERARFLVRYHEHVFPVTPGSLPEILAPAAHASRSLLLAFLSRSLADLPAPDSLDVLAVQRRQRDLPVLKRLLESALADGSPEARAVDAELAELNSSADRLDALLLKQLYRLAWWRVATREMSYRRFFDINQLVALRAERARVFAAVHRLVRRWLTSGKIQGVRVDHVDGLRDPEGYLERLRQSAPEAWLVVEKILEPGEALPARWPVDGTTGYDFLRHVDGLFVDGAAEDPLSRFYAAFSGEARSYHAVRVAMKRLVLTRLFGSDLKRLTSLFLAVCRRHRQHRDHTEDELELTLSEVIAQFPVYRTYVRPGSPVPDNDVRCVEGAVRAAGQALAGEVPADLLDFLRDLLLLRVPGTAEVELAVRFQQLSGPAMAKGGEDTAFYNYNRFVLLNEVGGDPGVFGVSPGVFHDFCRRALAGSPRGLLATSTHDTKRSEDVRARLALLSEIPAAWADAVRRLSLLTAHLRRGEFPDRNDEYLFYQTLVGAWPVSAERAAAYMEKAAREAKRHTSWRRRGARYEDALRGFVEGALGDASFVAEVEQFVAPLVVPGRINALSVTLLKLVAPGVPDLYRGTELWDLSLVDPDNRRPVDFATRRRLLAELADAGAEDVLRRSDEGAPKLWLIQRALALRKRRPELFRAAAGYDVLDTAGDRCAHAVAIARGGALVAVVPRLMLGLAGNWRDTSVELPAGAWRNVLTGESVDGGTRLVAELLTQFPVALLER